MLLQRIKSIFGSRTSEAPTLISSNIETIKGQIETLSAKDEAALHQSIDELDECLRLMEIEVYRIRDKAKGYPNSVMSGDVWFDGAALANYGEFLAHFLEGKALLKQQAKATNMWTGAVLSVCSHYRHMVGPAMIANAAISEKTGHLAYAKKAYSAVLQDFESVLDAYEDLEYAPEDEDRVSLTSLKAAAQRLVELGEVSGVNASAPAILEKVTLVLGKPNG